MSYAVALALAAAAYLVLRLLSATDVPRSKGLPEVPGVPVLGNLAQLGTDHARVAQGWATKYGPVFQARLGSKRIVFVNSYDAVRHFWITHQQAALISRPTFHTFHALVSSSQGFTIGTLPWDESCKRRRKAAATALNRPATQSYMAVVDAESTASIAELLRDGGGGERDVDPGAYMQRFALNTSLTLNYGCRIAGGVDSALLREISTLHSTSNNWQDYVPLLRLWGAQDAAAHEFRARRDRYLTDLLDGLKERIARGTDRPCITGNVLKDPEAKLNEAELKSICLTMVSAGLDTVPANLVMAMALLSTPRDQAVQAKALAAIEAVYPGGDAWDRCLAEEKVPYVTALVQETLRFFTVIPICLPQTSVRDIRYEGAVIPAGTTFFMNAYAADHDAAHFKLPREFVPERFLDADAGTAHFAYGAGSRMCAGSHLANRELYTALVRFVTAFELRPARDPADAPVIDAIECNATPTSLTLDPKPFKLRLRAWIAASEERTRGL